MTGGPTRTERLPGRALPTVVLDFSDRWPGSTSDVVDDEFAVEWQIEEPVTLARAVREATTAASVVG